jgi:hypothetical protein
MVDPVAKRAPRARRKPVVAIPDATAVLVVNQVTVDDDCVALQSHIAERLGVLRTEFQGVVASYSVKVQGMLSQAGDHLVDDAEKLTPSDRRRREKALRRILARLDALDLKPSKGRRRDLKAIELFANQAADEVAAW